MSVNYPTSGGAGLKTYKATALKATKAAVKESRGRLYGYHIYNPDTTDTFVQVFDALTDNVTVGTTTSKTTWWIPPQGGIEQVFSTPLEFNTGIGVAATTTSTGSSAPATGVLINLYYV